MAARRQRRCAVDEAALLASEPGDVQLERVRHAQFAHLRVTARGERFAPEPDLLSHIAMLRQHFGAPVVTGSFT